MFFRVERRFFASGRNPSPSLAASVRPPSLIAVSPYRWHGRGEKERRQSTILRSLSRQQACSSPTTTRRRLSDTSVRPGRQVPDKDFPASQSSSQDWSCWTCIPGFSSRICATFGNIQSWSSIVSVCRGKEAESIPRRRACFEKKKTRSVSEETSNHFERSLDRKPVTFTFLLLLSLLCIR